MPIPSDSYLAAELLPAIAAVIGLFMGALYGSSGFSDAGKSADLSKNPRIRNLAYVLGGGAIVTLADWRVVTSTLTPNIKLWMTICYTSGCLIGAAIVVIGFSVAIFISVSNMAKSKPALKDQRVELMLDYVSHGYASYHSKLEKARAAAPSISALLSSTGEIGVALSTLMSQTALAKDEDSDIQLAIYINQALEAIEDTLTILASGRDAIKLKSNYMVLVPSSLLNAAKVYFANKDAIYDEYLVFRRYRDNVEADVALPIERDNLSRSVLPGAPSCVTERAATHINVRKLEYRERVPVAVRKQIATYFKSARYLSVLSMPLIVGDKIVGVVNVESSLLDIVGAGPDCIDSLGQALAPYSLILGQLIQSSEKIRYGS